MRALLQVVHPLLYREQYMGLELPFAWKTPKGSPFKCSSQMSG
jgi:hypothetical protein